MKPSPLIQDNALFLRNFSQCRAKHAQQGMLERATDEQLLCFVEICLNVLKGRIPLARRHMHKLCQHKDALRRLARSRSAQTARRHLLMRNNQQGSGVPAIAGLLTSIIVPLITEKLLNV